MSSPRLRSGLATSSPFAAAVLVVSQLVLSSGCQKPTVQADPAAPPSSTPATTTAAAASSSPASTPSASAQPKPGSPLSRLVPVPRPVRSFCPLTIEPGIALGPIALGETLANLEKAGLKAQNVSDHHAEFELPATGRDKGAKTSISVSLCQGKIIDVWIDDLRRAPSCVSYAGTAIASDMPREALEQLVGSCDPTSPRIGGAFERCHDGGLYVGHGMGTFLQLRVQPKGWSFDDSCAIASDDGSLIALDDAQKGALLREVLNLSELSKYWHVDTPGRDPLRIVKTPLLPVTSLKMFGSDVVWIEATEAKKGTAFMTFSQVEATATRATVAFAYPIEGVRGTVTFRRQGQSEWRVERANVAER